MAVSRQTQAPNDGKLAILGAGSLGRLWAGYLPSGAAVFLARPRAQDSVAGPESTLSDPHNPVNYQLQLPEGGQRRDCSVPVLPAHGLQPSALLVTTKAGDTLPALKAQLPSLPPSLPIVLFQNGMGSQQAVADTWPDRPVLAATTTEGANRPEADLLIHAGVGETWIGGLNHSGAKVVPEVVNALKASGLKLHSEQNIESRLWQKLVVNAGINPFTAIMDCPNGDILKSALFLDHIDALCQEISQVMAKDTEYPMETSAIKERIVAVATSTAKNTSSMRSDRLKGRPTEIDVINGYIIERANHFNIPTPVNRMLVERVKELTL